MPIPKSMFWRIWQLASIFWCVLIVLTVALSGHWTIFNNRTLLHVLLQLIEDDNEFRAKRGALASFIRLALKGSMGVAMAAVVLVFLSTFAIITERRTPMLAFGGLNGVLGTIVLIFGIICFVGKTKTTELSRKMLEHGIQRYTTLDDAENPEKLRLTSSWRFVVDVLQMEGECCGLNGPEDYKNFFPVVNMSTQMRNACVCYESDCHLQHVPLSCCKPFNAKKPLDLRCAANYFENHPIQSVTCQSNQTVQPAPPTKVTFDGCKKVIDDMDHVLFVYYHGVLNVVVALLVIFLAIMLAVLACNVVPRDELIIREIQNSFKVDHKKATKMFDEVKNVPPSSGDDRDKRGSYASTRSTTHRDGLTQRDASTRLSSDRLGPRQPSVRQPSQVTRRK